MKDRIRCGRSSRWALMGLTAALSLLVHRADAAVSLVITPDSDGRGVVATWGSGAFPHTGPNQFGTWQGPDGRVFSFGSGLLSDPSFGNWYSAWADWGIPVSGFHTLDFFEGDSTNTGTGTPSFGSGNYVLNYSYQNLGTGAAPVWSGEY